jgi:hypothetical protein
MHELLGLSLIELRERLRMRGRRVCGGPAQATGEK